MLQSVGVTALLDDGTRFHHLASPIHLIQQLLGVEVHLVMNLTITRLHPFPLGTPPVSWVLVAVRTAMLVTIIGADVVGRSWNRTGKCQTGS
jgi:hypothetical protein